MFVFIALHRFVTQFQPPLLTRSTRGAYRSSGLCDTPKQNNVATEHHAGATPSSRMGAIDSNPQVMSPTIAGSAVTPMLQPPLPQQTLQPLSGRSCPYGPVGRTSDRDLRKHFLTSRCDEDNKGPINLECQQLDVTQDEHRARQLHTEYQHTLLTMEANLNLQAMHELVEVEAQARTYRHSRT
eukprot:1740088-Amphidinium_carterae.1